MAMTVLNVAFAFAPVGPGAVGGAEQILTELDGALTAAGHNSLVLACEGSQAAGTLFSTPLLGSDLYDADSRRWSCKQRQACFDRILSQYEVDLIHMHGLDFYEYKLPPEIPVLVTLHLPVSWYPQEIWSRCSGSIQFQCVSETQRRSCPPELRDAPIILNGVALPACTESKSDFGLALGRICPEKNQHEALEAGSLAGVRVLLGGQVFPYQDHRTYFYERIMPLLNGHEPMVHEFLGPLAPLRKQQLLGQAQCLLHPTLAPETSSLVAMEALAAGTPVIAYPSGALPEIVDDGVTGFLVHDVEEMAIAIDHVDQIRPEDCRAAARQRFSRERMIQDYFQLYSVMTEETVQERRYA
ncbi:MAG TPA: glycosyltransferase [Terriglobia bacterium]|nr:glycosyltransferase [Terriglobia bacterium]